MNRVPQAGEQTDEAERPLRERGLLALEGMHSNGKHQFLVCLGLPVQP